jgi:multidrug resistance efflux pump
MNERALAQAQRNQQAFNQYVRETAATSTSTADELAKLADLHDRGTISDEEFQHAKAKLLGRQPEPVAPPTPTGAR